MNYCGEGKPELGANPVAARRSYSMAKAPVSRPKSEACLDTGRPYLYATPRATRISPEEAVEKNHKNRNYNALL